MKTLVQINSVVNSGSTGHIAENIGLLAQENGYKCYIAYGRNDTKTDLIPLRIGNKISIIIHLIYTRLFDGQGLGSYFSTKKFLRKLDEINPDIIHLHNIHGYYLNYKLLFNWLHENKKPVVWTLHDCWSYTGHCAYYSFAQCDGWKFGCLSCKNKRNYPSSILFSRAKHNYSLKKKYFSKIDELYLVTPSSWLKTEVKNSFLGCYNCDVINNGIDLNVFYPHKHEIQKRTIILGVANVWDNRKGFKDFIELSKKITDDKEIILIGLSKEQISTLPKNIIGISKTENQDELAKYYSMADVFFNPTYEDNFPTTNIEALACGTPVITYDTGGSPEIIDRQTGYVVKVGQINDVIKYIEEIKQIGKNNFSNFCVKRAHDLYDNKSTFQKYINLYEKILNKQLIKE